MPFTYILCNRELGMKESVMVVEHSVSMTKKILNCLPSMRVTLSMINALAKGSLPLILHWQLVIPLGRQELAVVVMELIMVTIHSSKPFMKDLF